MGLPQEAIRARHPAMIVTIFRSRLDPDHAEEYATVIARIAALAKQAPGFLAIKSFTATDGERVSIVEFADQDSHDAWMRDPQHREAQKLGREKFYLEYRITVGAVVREREFRRPT